MYCNVNFKSKKELKTAVAEGRKIGVFQPGPFGGNPPQSGKVCLEGPHYPQPHKWYASAVIENGVIVKVS